MFSYSAVSPLWEQKKSTHFCFEEIHELLTKNENVNESQVLKRKVNGNEKWWY